MVVLHHRSNGFARQNKKTSSFKETEKRLMMYRKRCEKLVKRVGLSGVDRYVEWKSRG